MHSASEAHTERTSANTVAERIHSGSHRAERACSGTFIECSCSGDPGSYCTLDSSGDAGSEHPDAHCSAALSDSCGSDDACFGTLGLDEPFCTTHATPDHCCTCADSDSSGAEPIRNDLASSHLPGAVA